MRATFPIVIAFFCIVFGVATGDCQESEETVNKQELQDFDKLWDYNDPAATRAKFEELLPETEKNGNKSYRLQLQTQIARTYGLETQYDSAFALLDTIEKNLTDDLPVARIRYLLERGRTYRSSGSPEKSGPLFEESYALAKKNGADFHAIDAAHMMALVVKTPEDKRKWNLTAMDIAENSASPKARGWLGSLYNNMGWDYHDEKQYDKALDMFQKALKFRQDQGNQQQIKIAQWCIARTLRSMGRNDEALEKQLALLERHNQDGTKSGYVYEELGELYLLRGETDKSQNFFALAYEELSKDKWLAKNEAERLARIKELGKVE